MSFDLIIANPPYGKSSSLSRKIVNKIHEISSADIVCLAPPTTFKPLVSFVADTTTHDVDGAALSTGLFDVNDSNGIKIIIAKVVKQEVNKYKEYAALTLNEQELLYRKHVTNYNETHKASFESVLCDTPKDLKNEFLLSFWTGIAQCGGKVRYGEMYDICNRFDTDTEKKRDAYWRKTSTPIALCFATNAAYRNFRDWYYKAADNQKNTTKLKQFLFTILYEVYGGTPALRAYFEVLPNLDWSHPWTDKEILKEIGLPEDFL